MSNFSALHWVSAALALVALLGTILIFVSPAKHSKAKKPLRFLAEYKDLKQEARSNARRPRAKRQVSPLARKARRTSIRSVQLQGTASGYPLSLTFSFRPMCGGVDYADLKRISRRNPSAMFRVTIEDLKTRKVLAGQQVSVRALVANTSLSLMLPKLDKPRPVGLYICRDSLGVGACGQYSADRSGKRGVLYFSSLVLDGDRLLLPSKANYGKKMDKSLQSISPSNLGRQLIVPFARCPGKHVRGKTS